jgi:hypothetical protein
MISFCLEAVAERPRFPHFPRRACLIRHAQTPSFTSHISLSPANSGLSPGYRAGLAWSFGLRHDGTLSLHIWERRLARYMYHLDKEQLAKPLPLLRAPRLLQTVTSIAHSPTSSRHPSLSLDLMYISRMHLGQAIQCGVRPRLVIPRLSIVSRKLADRDEERG